MSTAKVTAKLAKLGHPEVALYRGAGYHYFVFNDADGKLHESRSEMVYRFRDIPFERWIREGVAFAEEMKAKLEELS